MTRTAVERGYERFVDRVVDATVSEFAIGNALRGADGPPGVFDRLLSNTDAVERTVIHPELERFRETSLAQFETLLDAVESDEPIDAYADQLLAHDSYRRRLRPDLSASRRDEIEAVLLDRQRTLGESLTPLMDCPEDDFWPAVRAVLTRSEAEQFVERHYRFTAPFESFRDAFRFETVVDPSDVLSTPPLVGNALPDVRIEYTDEAIRSLQRAEARVIEQARRDIERHYRR